MLISNKWQVASKRLLWAPFARRKDLGNSVRCARSQDECRCPPQSRFITAQMEHFQAAWLNNTSHMTTMHCGILTQPNESPPPSSTGLLQQWWRTGWIENVHLWKRCAFETACPNWPAMKTLKFRQHMPAKKSPGGAAFIYLRSADFSPPSCRTLLINQTVTFDETPCKCQHKLFLIDHPEGESAVTHTSLT